jgi:Tfp pilus assembly protein PilW
MRPHENWFRQRLGAQRGFSLVELMVAAVFTAILMAGFASVFKASLGNLTAASERIASTRRNRSSLDLLVSDLNNAGMLPSSLFNYPLVDNTNNPPFRILPNQAYTGTDVPSQVTDYLDMYYDNALPYDGTLATTLLGSADQVATGGALGDNKNFSVKLRDATQATAAAANFSSYGMTVMFKGSGYPSVLANAVANGSNLDCTMDATNTYSGSGSGGGDSFQNATLKDSAVTLIQPGRYVRYSIQPISLDPSLTTKTPCLVRNEVTYASVSGSATPFATPDATTIVAENVSGFKVLLSGDGGKTWAGTTSAGDPDYNPATTSTWAKITGPLTGAAAPTLNYQLKSGATPARPAMNSTGASPWWFREIPILVRVDITTRTANKRTEFTNTANTADYKLDTWSLVLTPKHFGLAYQPVN